MKNDLLCPESDNGSADLQQPEVVHREQRWYHQSVETWRGQQNWRFTSDSWELKMSRRFLWIWYCATWFWSLVVRPYTVSRHWMDTDRTLFLTRQHIVITWQHLNTSIYASWWQALSVDNNCHLLLIVVGKRHTCLPKNSIFSSSHQISWKKSQYSQPDSYVCDLFQLWRWHFSQYSLNI